MRSSFAIWTVVSKNQTGIHEVLNIEELEESDEEVINDSDSDKSDNKYC